VPVAWWTHDILLAMALPCDYFVFDLYTRTHFRYRYDEEINHFIETVVESAASRTVTWGQGTSLWRAQRGCKVCVELHGRKELWKEDTDGCGHPFECRPFSVERMKPEPEKAKEGRVNPKGIPCIYLATHKDTAMSEVRPWHEARISLARFELTQAVVLVDCSQDCPDEPTNKEAWNWYFVGEAFSRPVSSADDVSDYAPTQILAEAFRQCWYDGIIYNSGLNTDGKNVALFNLSHADVKERFLYTLSDVAYSFHKQDTGEYAEEAAALDGEQSQ
jgi:RES domain-containing protein